MTSSVDMVITFGDRLELRFGDRGVGVGDLCLDNSFLMSILIMLRRVALKSSSTATRKNGINSENKLGSAKSW